MQSMLGHALVVAAVSLALGEGCQGKDAAAGPEAAKKAHEAAIVELKQPIALISAYLPHVRPPEVTSPYMPKRRADVEKASLAAGNEVRHAANGAKQKLERVAKEATKDLQVALEAVATACTEPDEPEKQERCAKSAEALEPALQKADAAAAAAGAGKYPHVGPEAITEEAKKAIAGLLRTKGPGPAEKAYFEKRLDPNASTADVLTACQTAQGEIDAMAKAFEKADEPIRLVAVTHKMSLDSQCNNLNGAENMRRELEACKKPGKAKTPECKLVCSKVKALVADGVPAAAFAPLGKEYDETCEEPDAGTK
jgi:hypothetical protein